MPSGFDYSLDFENTNFREQPHLYRVGKGEQGVLSVEPYKSEILPHWRFRTGEVARESAERILAMFYEYKEHDDHRSGKKYDQKGEVRPQEADAMVSEKARATRVFYEKYLKVREDEHYKKRRKDWTRRYG